MDTQENKDQSIAKSYSEVSKLTDDHIDQLLADDEFRKRLVGRLLKDEQSATLLMQSIESLTQACPRCAVACWWPNRKST